VKELYVDGKWIKSSDLGSFDVLNPFDGSLVSKVYSASEEDIERGIKAAKTALFSWKRSLPKVRSRILRSFYESIIRDKDIIAALVVQEQGKVWSEALAEVDYAASFVEWFAEEAKRIYGEIIPKVRDDQNILTFRCPVGVVAAITPWNFPVAMVTRKISPAIAAGCTVVLKPSEETPLSALYLAKLLQESGLPEGVLNVLCGDPERIGSAMLRSPDVDMVTFTGSTEVGKAIYSECAKTVKRIGLELGGNAPFIAFEDCDIELAVDGLISSKLRSGGQSCICVNRVFVHESIFDIFISAIVERLKLIRVGNGMDKSMHLGPLINEKSKQKITDLVNNAVKNGASIIYQSDIGGLSGNFYPPTLVSNPGINSSIFTDEIFGPVISVFKFNNTEEVVRYANNTRYGLAGYVYTKNQNLINFMISELECGMVGINTTSISTEFTSFGGVKESGIGREGGARGIDEYLEDKFVVIS
jgi:succinate-semialdehyde dehydrogenase/glutarate-semialdehyde dehydrogenase